MQYLALSQPLCMICWVEREEKDGPSLPLNSSMGFKPRPHFKEIFTAPLSDLRLCPRPCRPQDQRPGEKGTDPYRSERPSYQFRQDDRAVKKFIYGWGEGDQSPSGRYKGGCLGCLQCGYDYQCSYGNQDEYVQFYKDQVKNADILILAGTIQDRYLSSRWKMFFDRSFFHTHTPSLIGKQVGFILSGPLRQISNLRQILEAYTEYQQANLVDIITDEEEDSKILDARLQHLAERGILLAEKNYIKPQTFLSVGGMKIFRDDVWGKLRFPFSGRSSVL